MNPNLDLPTVPRRRARPPKRKTRITIYLDDEVLDEFRSRAERTGTGYQKSHKPRQYRVYDV
jgi:uncharacterized protein (DUF4415 family)